MVMVGGIYDRCSGYGGCDDMGWCSGCSCGGGSDVKNITPSLLVIFKCNLSNSYFRF